MERYEWIATAAFGLEGVVARELARLGIDAKAENGGARFFGTFEDAFTANLHARCADRILLVVGRFEARSFEELFEGVRALPWENFIGEQTTGFISFPTRSVKQQDSAQAAILCCFPCV